MVRQVQDDGFERRLRALGFGVLRIEREADHGRCGTVEVTSIRFVLNADHGTSVLAVLKGVEVEEQVIAFVGGYDLSTVILDVARKLEKGTLRWKEDRPWGDRE